MQRMRQSSIVGMSAGETFRSRNTIARALILNESSIMRKLPIWEIDEICDSESLQKASSDSFHLGGSIVRHDDLRRGKIKAGQDPDFIPNI